LGGLRKQAAKRGEKRSPGWRNEKSVRTKKAGQKRTPRLGCQSIKESSFGEGKIGDAEVGAREGSSTG